MSRENDVKYTIAICHYNMAETVEESIRSIIEQVDDRFEVLIVDDGSDDGSVNILTELESEYNNLRLIRLDYDPERNLGETRNISFMKSNGEYILESLDADDRYSEGILDFVEIYHQIEAELEFEFYLKGDSINMASKNLLLDIPYRNFARAQDHDLWRRLFAQDKIIWIEHEKFWEQIGYNYNTREAISNLINSRVADFRGGVTFRSYLKWSLEKPKMYSTFGNILIGFVALVIAYLRGRYKAPGRFKKKGELHNTIQNKSYTLSEIEQEYSIEIDRSKLSDRGKELFIKSVSS
jgi:glycosyltransferase involved in cell wall biosynthesis